MSRPTVQRSDLAGWGRLRLLRLPLTVLPGPRLYLVCTPTGMPILRALANPTVGERDVLAAMLQIQAGVVAEHDGILLISDKGFASKPFERLARPRGPDGPAGQRITRHMRLSVAGSAHRALGSRSRARPDR